MAVQGVYEVFVLLDHASDLVAGDDAVSGLAALDIAAGQAIASDLAVGVEPVPVVLPGSVRECLEAAGQRVLRWEPAELSTEALLLVALVLQLGLELSGA